MQNYQLTAVHTITSLVRKNKTEPVIVSVGVMEISYRDLTAGFIIGSLFSLFSFMLGYYAEIPK